MREELGREFFERPAPAVAPELLGKFLVRRIGGREIASMIIETEAYEGANDRASHASRGRTERTAVMFGEAGVWYVYFIYGMYWMLNVVAGTEGHPSAVLIRGVEDAGGPGKLTKHFRIDKSFNEKSVSRRSGLWIEDRGAAVIPKDIKRSARVGVHYAGPYWARRKWRFFLNRG